jgi:hypothetical protein
MIQIFLSKNDNLNSTIKDIVDEMVIRCEIVRLDPSNSFIFISGQRYQIPLLMDSKKHIEGEKNIVAYLEELHKFKEEWDKFQSDSCYCDDDGNIE